MSIHIEYQYYREYSLILEEIHMLQHDENFTYYLICMYRFQYSQAKRGVTRSKP